MVRGQSAVNASLQRFNPRDRFAHREACRYRDRKFAMVDASSSKRGYAKGEPILHVRYYLGGLAPNGPSRPGRRRKSEEALTTLGGKQATNSGFASSFDIQRCRGHRWIGSVAVTGIVELPPP